MPKQLVITVSERYDNGKVKGQVSVADEVSMSSVGTTMNLPTIALARVFAAGYQMAVNVLTCFPVRTQDILKTCALA